MVATTRAERTLVNSCSATTRSLSCGRLSTKRFDKHNLGFYAPFGGRVQSHRSRNCQRVRASMQIDWNLSVRIVSEISTQAQWRALVQPAPPTRRQRNPFHRHPQPTLLKADRTRRLNCSVARVPAGTRSAVVFHRGRGRHLIRELLQPWPARAMLQPQSSRPPAGVLAAGPRATCGCVLFPTLPPSFLKPCVSLILWPFVVRELCC
jgi:hypothetical protein